MLSMLLQSVGAYYWFQGQLLLAHCEKTRGQFTYIEPVVSLLYKACYWFTATKSACSTEQSDCQHAHHRGVDSCGLLLSVSN